MKNNNKEIDRFRQELADLLLNAPDGCWLYVASGELWLMALGEDGKRVTDDTGGFDQRWTVDGVPSKIEIDGGDW